MRSRLEGLNKLFGTRIQVSESTFEAANDSLCARELDRVRVSGKARPVTLYELPGDKDDEKQFRDWMGRFASVVALYREMKWDEAIAAFEQILTLRRDDEATKMYIERCRNLKMNPPSEPWDGVFVVTSR